MDNKPKKEQKIEKMTETKQQHEFHSYNPFIEDVVEHITETKRRKVSGWKWEGVVDENTGDITQRPMLVLGDIKVLDSAAFYKVYIGEIKSFFGLTNASMLLFEYIMNNIGYGNDKICLTVDIIKADNGMAKSTIYRAIDQLLDKKVIAKASLPGCYYINPKIAFKGDRITLVKQYVREQVEVHSRQIKKKN
jgi:predicted transcriptional regulator